MASDKRPTLSDILGNGSEGFNDLWNNTPAAEEPEPLPGGTYRCLLVDGKLSESKSNKTPSYRVTFQVLDGPFKGRKLWEDFWLTPAALPTTKRELSKVGINQPDQLKQPPPAGLVADVRVALNTE